MSEVDVPLDTDELDEDMADRCKFGVDDKLTLRQEENRKKIEVYIKRRLTSLDFIHKADEINLDQSAVDESLHI